MPNEGNIDQSAYHLLGLDPRKQLKRTQLLVAKARAEAEIEDICINRHEKQKRKEYIYDAYRHLILVMKAKKSKEQQEFIELEEEERQKYPEYKPPAPKKTPIELLITNHFEAEGFVLLKGTLDDIRIKFDQWLIQNNLAGQGFSLVLKASAHVKDAFTLSIQGPAQGPHAGKLGVFYQELIMGGYISARENVNAAAPIPTPTAVPTLIPTSKTKKRAEEEDEKLGVPKPFGMPTPSPYKK